jgi:hypothetical protein
MISMKINTERERERERANIKHVYILTQKYIFFLI